MRYFVLVDLITQAECLPREMQSWSQERMLSWLGLFGEVSPWPLDWAVKMGLADHVVTIWVFRAPTGREARFVVSKSNQFALVFSDLRLHQIWGEEISSVLKLET